MSQVKILAISGDGASAARASSWLRIQGVGDVSAYSPTPDHAILSELQHDVSPVRLFILIGAGLGCFLGVAFPVYTMLDWPLITGGKPTISIPPLVVTGFAVAILLGALGGVAGFLSLARLPALSRSALYDPRFSEDRFGVLATCELGQAELVRACFWKAGAEELKEQL
jgi:molybdopterin-containing oxidoreductase family membrane subunit